MTVFDYTAVNADGRKAAGSVPAPHREAALDQIARKGLTPISVKEQSPARPRRAGPSARPGRVSPASVEAFDRELANLLAGGVPLSRALHILSREASQAAARQQWTAIRDDVIGGLPLAGAMSKWPQSFPPVHIAMVRAGETGGFLELVLGQIADFRSRERDLKSRLRAALIYPMVLAVLATSVLVFLLTYFIPRFSGIFEEFGANLPALTLAIVAVSRAVTQYGLLLVVAAACIAVLAARVARSEAGRRALERTFLRLPGVGDVLARFALVRFCRMLGTLLGAGVPLVTSLKVAREALGNQTLSDAMAVSIEEVQRGAPLAGSLASCPRLFPGSVTEMIAVAEESARLDQELVRLAAVNEAELDRRLRVLVALAEPALLFVMAAVVGTVVIGMLLPVFTLQDYIR